MDEQGLIYITIVITFIMNPDSPADIKDFLTAYEKMKTLDKLKFYIPFNEGSDETSFTDTQASFHADTHKKRWLFSGNRSGKTMAGAAEAIFYALGPEGEKYWAGLPEEAKEKYANIRTPNEGWVVASDHNVQIEASQKWVMKMLPDDVIQNINKNRNKILNSVQLTNGSDITFKSSAAGAKSFEGAAKRWIWFDEEPQYESVYNECIMRESGAYPLDLWGTMTPVKGITFTYDRIWKKQKEDDTLRVFQWATMDNPHLPQDVVDNLKKEYSDEPKELKRRLYGEFVGRSGLVYPMFDEETHIIKPFTVPGDWTIYEGIDLGFTNPSAVVWIAVSPDNIKYVIDEFKMSELSIRELANHILEKRKEARYTEQKYYKPLLSLIDPSSQSRSQPLDDRGRNDETAIDTPRKRLKQSGIHTKLADNSVWQGLENVRDDLRVKDRESDERPNLLVFNNCEEWIDEMANYRLKQYRSEKTRERKSSPEKPQKKNDHLMDSTRYVINEGVRQVAQTGVTGTTKKPKTGSSAKTGY